MTNEETQRSRAVKSALTAGEMLAQALESIRPVLNDHDRLELDARVELFRKLAADAMAEPVPSQVPSLADPTPSR